MPTPAPVHSFADIIAAASAIKQQPRRIFTYPVSAQLQALQAAQSFPVVENFTIALLRDGDEAAAADRSSTVARVPVELAKGALFAVNGRRVSLGDGSTDTAWGVMHPKVHALVQRMYQKTHYPDDSEVEFTAGGCVSGFATDPG